MTRHLTSVKATRARLASSAAVMDMDLLRRYGGAVPRYTSYPTAPHFHPGVDAATYGQWLGALAGDERASLYLHIPYCDRLCWYCGCHTKITRRYAPIAAYLDSLVREIELVAEALPGPLDVGHVHWGGGSPTILTGPDFLRLMAVLRARFSFAPGAELAVEIDPATLSEAKAEALGRAGLTRASLGVQDFNAEVQAAINRVQSFEMTARAAAWLKQAGIAGLNIDLMYGLPRQSVAGVLRSIDLALDLSPDRIALFCYSHVPCLKKHQRLIDVAHLTCP